MACAPGMNLCKRQCQHANMVREYRTARLAAEMARDNAVGAHGPGSQEWADYPRIITFKGWLTGMAGQQEARSA